MIKSTKNNSPELSKLSSSTNANPCYHLGKKIGVATKENTKSKGSLTILTIRNRQRRKRG
ncbi:MAG TPA: hypothetical protein VJP58_05235 [Candidatus Nitrosocosmicus sp.]|nr:hypothetical protein [Candidatus Nitrosocosmicus sp.]